MWVTIVEQRCRPELVGIARFVGMDRAVTPKEVHVSGLHLDHDGFWQMVLRQPKENLGNFVVDEKLVQNVG